jgi:hypothetical protein
MLHLVSSYNNGASQISKPILVEEQYTLFSRSLNEESFDEKKEKESLKISSCLIRIRI